MRSARWSREGNAATGGAGGQRHDLERAVEGGLLVGMAAAVPTILVLMAAGATYRGVGGYTAMYSVAGLLDPAPLELALEAAAHGRPVAFYHEPFVAGAAVCLILGALSGAGFALGVRRRNVRNRRALLLIGPAHGLFCMSLFYFGVLYAVNGLLGGARTALTLGELLGMPTLIGAHALYGLVLGAWYAYLAPGRLSPSRLGGTKGG